MNYIELYPELHIVVLISGWLNILKNFKNTHIIISFQNQKYWIREFYATLNYNAIFLNLYEAIKMLIEF